MNARSLMPYATRTQTFHVLPHRRVAEESSDYHQDDEPGASATTGRERGVAERIEIEAVRRTADVQIGRLLRLANALDGLEGDDLQAERGPVSEGVRDAASILEQHLHKLADALEKDLL